MPKTAICFSGELRSIDKTFPILESNILSKFSDYDIFYFTWADDPDIDKLKYLIKTNRIKDIEIKSRETFDEDFFFPKKPLKTNFQSIIRQLYCLKKVNDLKCQYELEHDFKYDIVVRIRPDLNLLDDTKLSEDFEKKDFSKLYLLDHDNWHGFSDRFYVSNSSNMDILSNRIEVLQKYSDMGGSQQYEAFLQYVTIDNDIEVERIEGLKTCLQRNDGSQAGELISIKNGEIEWRDGGIFHISSGNFI